MFLPRLHSVCLLVGAVACTGDTEPAPLTADGLLTSYAAVAAEPADDWPGINRWMDQTGELRKLEDGLLPQLTDTPDDPLLLAELGRIYTDAGAHGRAMWFLTRALQGNAEHATSWVYLGASVGRMGDLEEALVLYERAMDLDRDLTAAFVQSALTYERLGELARARTVYEESIERNPRHLEARLGLARLLEADGELEAARVQLERALDVESDSPTALFRLARILAELGRDEEAAEVARAHERAAILEDLRMRRYLPTSTRIMQQDSVPRIHKLLALAEFFLGNGRVEDARLELVEAREIARSDRERVAVLAGLLRCARANAGESAELTSALAEIAPDHPLLSE